MRFFKEEARMFFFEKKNQKTFAPAGACTRVPSWPRLTRPSTPSRPRLGRSRYMSAKKIQTQNIRRSPRLAPARATTPRTKSFFASFFSKKEASSFLPSKPF
jgi:hypothetical protein